MTIIPSYSIALVVTQRLSLGISSSNRVLSRSGSSRRIPSSTSSGRASSASMFSSSLLGTAGTKPSLGRSAPSVTGVSSARSGTGIGSSSISGGLGFHVGDGIGSLSGLSLGSVIVRLLVCREVNLLTNIRFHLGGLPMRSIDEWIGPTDETRAPPRVRASIFDRDDSCHLCG